MLKAGKLQGARSGGCVPQLCMLPCNCRVPLHARASVRVPQRCSSTNRHNGPCASKAHAQQRSRRGCRVSAVAAPSAGSQSGHKDKNGAVIVGGGPVGLAAAIMLAKRGWRDITVVEQQRTVTEVYADRSYIYLIDGRGRKFMDPHGLMPDIAAAAHYIEGFGIVKVTPDGTVEPRFEPLFAGIQLHALPRAALLGVLSGGISKDPDVASRITVRAASRCTSISKDAEGQLSVVVEPTQPGPQPPSPPQRMVVAAAASVATPEGAAAAEQQPPAPQPVSEQQPGREVLHPRLLIGADGIRSIVRNTLATWDPAAYALHSFPSDSSGMRYKILPLPPNPPTKKGLPLKNSSTVTLQGLPCSQLPGATPLRLGMMPLRDDWPNRTANLYTLPDHPVWDIRDAGTMYAVLQESFPQMDWHALVPQQVMERFASSRGGYFPTPQCVTTLIWEPPQTTPSKAAPPAPDAPTRSAAATSSDAAAPAGTCVVLVGDAAHAFPPDMGQGLISGLEDLSTLAGALDEEPEDLQAALQLYQERRAEDTMAVAQLMQVAAPLQYRQYKYRAIWFMVRTAFHLLLHKLLPTAVDPPPALGIQDYTRSYSKIWKGFQRSRVVMWAVLAMMLVGVATTVLKTLV